MTDFRPRNNIQVMTEFGFFLVALGVAVGIGFLLMGNQGLFAEGNTLLFFLLYTILNVVAFGFSGLLGMSKVLWVTKFLNTLGVSNDAKKAVNVLIIEPNNFGSFLTLDKIIDALLASLSEDKSIINSSGDTVKNKAIKWGIVANFGFLFLKNIMTPVRTLLAALKKYLALFI